MASRHSQRIKTGKSTEESGKKKKGGTEAQPMDIVDEDEAPLSQLKSKIKKRKAQDSQSHATGGSTEQATKDQGLDTPDSKKKEEEENQYYH